MAQTQKYHAYYTKRGSYSIKVPLNYIGSARGVNRTDAAQKIMGRNRQLIGKMRTLYVFSDKEMDRAAT